MPKTCDAPPSGTGQGVRPERSAPRLTARLAAMLAEMESTRLEVAKIRTPRGGYVRVAVSVNAEWYQHLCRRYLSTRRRFPRPRTLIKRRDTLAALRRMILGNLSGVYAARILKLVGDFYGHEKE